MKYEAEKSIKTIEEEQTHHKLNLTYDEVRDAVLKMVQEAGYVPTAGVYFKIETRRSGDPNWGISYHTSYELVGASVQIEKPGSGEGAECEVEETQ